MNKYLIAPLKQRFLSLWVTPTEWTEWANNWDFFFILALGRSGTAFLAHLLNQARGAYVFHEPAFEDFEAAVRAFYSPLAAERYMQQFRKKEIYLRMRNTPPGVYGEVNSGLRRHTEAIKTTFPNATLVHLVRDGRDVVRSMMSRRTMTLKDPFTSRIHPTGQDSCKARWTKMDRFARICWFWQSENSYLRTKIGNPVQFEKILSSYEYFYNTILAPCHIFIDKKEWETAVVSPNNRTSTFRMQNWDTWTPRQQETFREICGDEMAECGYVF
jgi:hypothetical protein